MPRSSEFNGAITGRNIIAGSHMETGATMNNYFGSYPIMQDGSSRKREPFSTVPFSPDHDFVDRPEILAWIHDKCAGPGARAALAGLGGVGKSQLAIRYANNIRDVSPQTFVLWVHASTKARFEEAYRGIADRLELPGRNDPKVDVLRLVSNWLCDETHGRWIMILDNADDVDVFYLSRAPQRNESFATASARLVTYLPQSRNGSILITSRSKDVAARLAGNYNNIKEVHAMGESQALYLFRNKLQSASNEEGAADLLRALDYIPLAITQAAAFINRRGRITASGYLDEFRKNDKKKESLLSWDSGNLRRDGSASNSVVLTWQMSFECIHEQRRSATDLLSLMSFFNPQGIPEWILRKHSKSVAKTGDESKDNSAFDEDLDTLQAYSLIIATADGRMCGMHALVQFCTRAWLSTFSNPKQWDREFLGLMAREFPLPDFKNWAKCQQLLPHVESLYESDLTDHESVMKWALVLNKAARYIQTALGKYDEAEKLCRRVLEGCKKELGEQHPNTLTSVGNLALVLQDQGKHGEAEKLNRLALQGLEKKLGKRHPNTLTSVGNLASALQDQGKYNEAEKLNRRALEWREKKLGERHPDTLKSVGNLASVLQDQGKYDRAEKLNRRALEGFEKELGEQHPDTLASVYNLAYLLHKRKRYVEASGLYQRACNGYKQKLGTQHRTTIACLNSFSAMQREAEQEGLGQSRTLINNGKAEHRETSTHSFTSLTSSGTTPKPVDSKQKSKQGSLYARLKRRIAEMTYGI
ncbi:P-loop containing nucleoside triphosphate hydrolase protein [Bisporella sp. PMI_857]|nr:P-loop containing nucleoside triphosphate hydrolase protein [Bisporella sp. PMI_857]